MKAGQPRGFPVWGWIIAAVIVVIGLYGVVKTSRDLSTCPFEIKALVALRALSNVEQAYRDYNEDHRYATLDGLKENGFVKYGFTPGKIVSGYRVEVIPLSYYNDSVHSFVIRMFPTNPSRPCGTFQMGPNKRLMEFVPRVNSDIHRVENWIDATYVMEMLPERGRLDWMGDNYYYN